MAKFKEFKPYPAKQDGVDGMVCKCPKCGAKFFLPEGTELFNCPAPHCFEVVEKE